MKRKLTLCEKSTILYMTLKVFYWLFCTATILSVLGYIGTMGLLECDRITIGESFVRDIICTVVFAVTAFFAWFFSGLLPKLKEELDEIREEDRLRKLYLETIETAEE